MVKTMISGKIPDNLLQQLVNICSNNSSYNLTRDGLIDSKPSSRGSLSPLKSSGSRGDGIINIRNNKSNEMKATLGIPDFCDSKQEVLKYA